MIRTRRGRLCCSAALLALAVSSLAQTSAPYPAKKIRLIVPGPHCHYFHMGVDCQAINQ